MLQQVLPPHPVSPSPQRKRKRKQNAGSTIGLNQANIKYESSRKVLGNTAKKEDVKNERVARCIAGISREKDKKDE